jgi:hypothetical protein
LQDAPRLRTMSEAARALAHPNAAKDIAAMAARVAGIEEPATDWIGFSRIRQKQVPRLVLAVSAVANGSEITNDKRI